MRPLYLSMKPESFPVNIDAAFICLLEFWLDPGKLLQLDYMELADIETDKQNGLLH